MLEFLKVKHPDQFKNLIQDFNPNKQTWIVSDLKSKQEIQNICLKKFSYYQDESILRVSDFWQIWLRRLKPTLHIVSSDFIKVLVQLFIDDYGHEIDLAESDFSSLNRYVQEFAPIILHPESDLVIDEWLQTQNENKKWIEWYKKARVCLKFIVSEKKVLDQKWSAAYLQTLDLQQIEWPHEMIVDLGTELTSIEMGLFKILSHKQKVCLLVPDPEWASQFPYLLKTYNENLGLGKVNEQLSELAHVRDSKKYNIEFIRLSTQLSEVKHSVGQVREWLNAGIAVNSIALIAVQIEDYWPVLEKYLEIEGVPYQKDVVASLNSLSSIQIFLAHLKSLTSDVSYASLQQKLFQQNQNPEIKFEKFKSLFYQLYDENDLARSELVKKLFFKKINLKEKINRDEFLTILVKIWAELPMAAQMATQKINLFELVFKDLIAQSLETSMRFNRWYQFLKSRLSHKEVKIRSADVEGVQVLSLMSAQSSHAEYRIYLGMNEESFQSKKKSMLPLLDIEKLKNDFDLAIDYPDENHFDFNLRWQVEQSCKEQILLSPHLSFLSEPLTGSAFFMQNLPQSEVMKPKITRQDEIQSYLALHKEEDLNLYHDVVSKERIQADLFGQNVLIPSEEFLSLSTAHLENYAQCSFKLLAAKGFRLQDLPEAAIDLDPRQKGSLVHSLFEYLLPKIKTNEFNLKAIDVFLDQHRNEAELYLNEDLFWAVQKRKMLKLAVKFYEFENQRMEFQNFTEQNFELYFDFSNQTFSKEKTPQSILIKGRIDRIDKEQQKNYYLIYDYKSSGSGLVHHDKWLSEFKLQLLIYLFAVETCLFEDAQVKGALYYLYKNFDLNKGIVDKEIALQDLHFSKNNKSLIEGDEKEKIKKDFIHFMSKMFQSLQKGEFTAKPYDTKICIDCDWRKLCRAVHL